jgi:hypothetical protein
VDKTTRGKQSVIVAFVLPFGARKLEAYLHRRYRKYHAPLKFGSGRTEFFKRGLWICEALVIAGAVCLWQWVCAVGRSGVGFIYWFKIWIMTKRMKQIVKDLQNGGILITHSSSNEVGLWMPDNSHYKFGSFLLFRMEQLEIVYQEPRYFDYVLTAKYRK